MKNKVIKLVAFCMATILMIFLPGIFNLGFEIYLDVSMKSTGKLPTIGSYEKLEKLLASSGNTYYSRVPNLDITNDFAAPFSGKNFINSASSDGIKSSNVINSLSLGMDLSASQSSISSTPTTSTDYSTTNTQVLGVDEADILKNDGKYIYTIANDKLVIIEAFPASEMKKVSELKIEEGYTAIDMYICGDKLFLVTDNRNSVRKYYSSDEIITKINVIDITNRKSPNIVKKFELTGVYSSSRMIDEKIYLFSNMGVRKKSGQYVLPQYRESDVSIFKEIDLSEVQYVPNDRYTSFTQIFTFDLNTPLNSPKVVTYLGSSAQNVYMSQDNLYMAQTRNGETIIYKFNLNSLYPRFEGRGSVPGTIVNQFAMDEFDGNFRIATTKNNVSAVYILSRSMHRLGSVTNIARGEQIKSVRFEGERGYVVTFRNTDPLFVIDLSNVRAPRILGELKIPGYSTYLHTYDEDHVIGFGYDGTEWGTNGKLKLALFDITDVTRPKEMFKEVIDARTSELLTNHKSLLFSKDRNLIAFSVGNYNSNKVGKAYTINLEDGFVLRGEINHDTDVNRMLYMDNVLYGVSEDSVSAHDIKTIEELNRIDI